MRRLLTLIVLVVAPLALAADLDQADSLGDQVAAQCELERAELAKEQVVKAELLAQVNDARAKLRYTVDKLNRLTMAVADHCASAPQGAAE